MKKINFLVILLLMVLQAQCFAVVDTHGTLNPQQLVIGGISLRNTRAYFEQVYGPADFCSSKKQYAHGRVYYYDKTYHYGNSLAVKYFEDNRDSQIYEIKVTANNGFATIDGVTVGMPEKVLRAVYGAPTTLQAESPSKDGKMENKEYIYYGVGGSCLQYFRFTVRDGVIKEIVLHWSE